MLLLTDRKCEAPFPPHPQKKFEAKFSVWGDPSIKESKVKERFKIIFTFQTLKTQQVQEKVE